MGDDKGVLECPKCGEICKEIEPSLWRCPAGHEWDARK